MLKRLSIVMLAALAVACGDDRPLLKVGTAGSSFQRESVPSTSMSPVAYVPYDIRNSGNETAFIPTCGPRTLPVVEKLVNGHWEGYASGFCVMSSLMVPLELRAGESHHDELAIGDAGRFRIRMPYSADAQMRNRFESISARFDVR